MNRTIWIWRVVAVLILLIFAILMWNLYARLTSINRQRIGVAVTLQSEGALADGTRGGLARARGALTSPSPRPSLGL